MKAKVIDGPMAGIAMVLNQGHELGTVQTYGGYPYRLEDGTGDNAGKRVLVHAPA